MNSRFQFRPMLETMDERIVPDATQPAVDGPPVITIAPPLTQTDAQDQTVLVSAPNQAKPTLDQLKAQLQDTLSRFFEKFGDMVVQQQRTATAVKAFKDAAAEFKAANEAVDAAKKFGLTSKQYTDAVRDAQAAKDKALVAAALAQREQAALQEVTNRVLELGQKVIDLFGQIAALSTKVDATPPDSAASGAAGSLGDVTALLATVNAITIDPIDPVEV